MRKLAVLGLAAVIAAMGCGGPSKAENSLIGSWQVEVDSTIKITETFEKDGKVTVDVRNFDIGNHMTGTYTVEGDQLAVKLDKSVPLALPADEAEKFQHDWMERAQKANTGTIEWISPDEVYIKGGAGTNRLKRVSPDQK